MKSIYLTRKGKEPAGNVSVAEYDHRIALRVVLWYLVFGVAWILITDRFVTVAIIGVQEEDLAEMIKGIFFVFLSGGLIYFLVDRFNRSIERQTEELNAAFSTTDLGLMHLDRKGNIESFTRCIADLVGIKPEKLAATNISDLTHPEDREALNKLMNQLLSGNIDKATESFRLLRSDGTSIWVEQNLRFFNDNDQPSLINVIQWIDNRIEAERELSERAVRLQRAQEIAKLGDWTYDPETGNITWSHEMYRILDRDFTDGPVPMAELYGKYLGTEDADKLRAAVDRAAASGEGYDLELVLHLDENTQKYVRAVGVAISLGGNQWKLRGIVQDITEMHQLQQSLNVHQEQVRMVLNNLPGVIYQYHLRPDNQHGLTYVSEGAEYVWGVSSTEAIENLDQIWANASPETMEKVWASIVESRDSLKPWNCRWQYPHPKLGMRWHEGFGLPQRLEDGTTVWNSITLDVTERVMMETRLQQHEGYWTILNQHSSDGIIICDENARLVFFNDVVREWQGEMLPDLNPDEWASTYGLYTLDGSRLLRTDEIGLMRALKGEKIADNRHSVKQPGKPRQIVESSGGPLHDDQGNLIGAMVILRNITERYNQEFEITDAVIQAAEQERTRIASELHDSITQELSVVSLNLNNFRLENMEGHDSSRFNRAQERLQEAIEHTRSLSHRLMPASVRDLGMIGAVSELAEDLNSPEGPAITVHTNKELRLPEAMEFDIFRIVQEAVQNVLKHAKASKAGIHFIFNDGSLHLSVHDNGVGFEASDPHGKNVGVGLRSMQNRTQKWDGRFHIDSSNAGTTVSVKIPIREE